MNWQADVRCGLVALALLGGGCGTVRNVQQAIGPKAVPELPPDAPMQRVYGGVRADWHELTGRRVPGSSQPARPVYALLDLPLSAVGDTLTLPYVLAWEKGLFGLHLMNYPQDYHAAVAALDKTVNAPGRSDAEPPIAGTGATPATGSPPQAVP